MAEKTNRKSTPRYKSQMEPHDEESWKSRFGPKDAGYECGHSPKSPAHHRAFPQNWNRPGKSSLSCGSPDVNTLETSPSHKHRGQRSSPADRKNWRDRPRDGQMHGDDMQKFKEVNTFVSIDCCLIKADIFQLFMEAGNSVGESGHSKERRIPILGFKCEKCEVYYWDMAQAFSHIRERSHRNKAKELQRQKILMNIPAPGSAQCDLISSAIERVVTEFGLNDQDLNQRQNILSVIETVLRPVLPECQFRLYGSSLTKLGFKNSDVNIDVKFPSTFQHPDVLLLAKEHLSKSDLFVDVFGDFHRRPPLVVCTEKSSGLICRVSAGNESACWTTEYLAELTSLEPRIVPLIICFRHWARICRVDNMGEGGIPSYCFALMVISFLQRCKEPVLPSYLESASLPVSKLKSFSITGVKQGNVLWVIDPSSSSQDKERVVTRGMAPLVFEDRSRPWSPGKLWVDLLRYYTVEFQIQRKVISVRTNGDLWRDLKDWPKNRIAIEDPFAVQGNVARTMNSQLMFYYMLHCLRTTYKYFASPAKLPAKKKGLSLSHGGEPEASVFQSDSETQKGSRNVASSLDGAEQLEDSDCIIELEMDVEEEAESDVESEAEQEEDEDDDDDKNELPEVDESGCDHSGDEIFSFDDELSENAADTQAEVVSQDASPDTHPGFKYVFNKQVFSNGKPHVLVCSLCNSDGHLKQDCPDDFKPEKLQTLPVLTLDFLKTLNDVCEQCYSDFSPDDLEDKVREHVRQEFETFLRFHIPGAKLTLFGSSKNGFGFKQSDLDICMTLEGQDTAMGLDFMSIFESLTDVLNKHSGLRNVQPITSAKVPIVKFYHNKSGLEGDISLYNTLPLHNTELLASYAAIDDRVKILCYVMKVFAKVCDIGDASRGSLSSYAYTLMVLYFLQQRKPPVIPVLQEISDGESKQAMLVDGWDVQFFKDLKNLHRCWPDYRKNKESVGELWLGLLQFYTEMFDFKEHVICIRRKEPLTTLKKQWTSKHLSIEDPFDLSHNLGGGLSRKMANFIIKAFINARTVFGSPVQIFPAVYSNKMEYFFDPDVLTEGKLAPNDRCCRFCGKVGHFMKECPIQKKKPTKAMREHGSYKDKWVREKEERSCFLCGSSSHMKRDCQLSGSLDSPRRQSPASTRAKHGSPQRDGTKRHKVKKVILGPEHGSLVNRHGSFLSPVQGASPFRGKRESKSVED